jgi:Fe-S cluster assembly protein SufB
MTEPMWQNVRYAAIDYQDIIYYSAPKKRLALNSLDEGDPEIRATYGKPGIPLEEQQLLAGVAVDAVFDSVSVRTTFGTKLASCDCRTPAQAGGVDAAGAPLNG